MDSGIFCYIHSITSTLFQVNLPFPLLSTLTHARQIHFSALPTYSISISIQSITQGHFPILVLLYHIAISLFAISIFLYRTPLKLLPLFKLIRLWGEMGFLHKAGKAILEPLHHIFLLCIKQSSLPSEWRDHYITPIPKSGDRSLVSNYRPISLLSSV